MVTPEQSAELIVTNAPKTRELINAFTEEVLKTRGGRLGSGMGSLIEALWGYYLNGILCGEGIHSAECEIGWLVGHEYNDFACICRDAPWEPGTRQGELLRIEAKSMNLGVDESKAHFDEIHLREHDLLLVIVWKWAPVDALRVYPQIVDQFIGNAICVAQLRDSLHLARRGSFVDKEHCPDKCNSATCTHNGEPLNARGKRERLEGPESRRPSRKTSYANNFGGLVRMLKTDSEQARQAFRKVRRESDIAHAYVSFIHRNFPNEELNQYTIHEWRALAEQLGLQPDTKAKDELAQAIQARDADYHEKLRLL